MPKRLDPQKTPIVWQCAFLHGAHSERKVKSMLTLDKIYHASYVLRDVVRETALIHAPKINPECDVYLKPENLQITGSFKVRGAGYTHLAVEPGGKSAWRDRLFCRQPCAGRCAGRGQIWDQVADLPAGRCADLQGGGNKILRRRGLYGAGSLRRCLQTCIRASRREKLYLCASV